MGWDKQGKWGPYYTRSVKRDGRVYRQYIGGGAVGELMAQADMVDRERRRAETLAFRAECGQANAEDVPVAEFCEAVDILVSGVLLTNGYYRHNHGEWRLIKND